MFHSSFPRRLCLLAAVLLAFVSLIACDVECPHLRMEREPFSPDCSEEGYTLNRCKDCGYEYKSNFVSPTGHTLSTAVTNPSCTEQGFTVYSCSRLFKTK